RSLGAADWAATAARIGVSSRLREIAVLPAADTASARTGPPWPRSCACAGVSVTAATASASTARGIASIIRRHHAERGDACAHIGVAQCGEESLHGGSLLSALNQQEIIVFRRDCDEGQAVEPRHRL